MQCCWREQAQHSGEQASFSHSGLLKAWFLKAVLRLTPSILVQPVGWAGRFWLPSFTFISRRSSADACELRRRRLAVGLGWGAAFVWQGKGCAYTPFLCRVVFHHAALPYSWDPHGKNCAILANAISSYDSILINDTCAEGSPCRCSTGVLTEEYSSWDWFVLVLQLKWGITSRYKNSKKTPLA